MADGDPAVLLTCLALYVLFIVCLLYVLVVGGNDCHEKGRFLFG